MNQRTDEEVVRAASLTPASEVSVEAMKAAVRKFTKKPITIEAVQWTGNNGQEIELFVDDGNMMWAAGENKPIIRTLEGNHTALVGDYIIKGIKGEFYPCKPDIFALTYDPASPESSKLPTPTIQLQDVCECGHNRLEHATRIYGPGCPCGCKGFKLPTPIEPQLSATETDIYIGILIRTRDAAYKELAAALSRISELEAELAKGKS